MKIRRLQINGYKNIQACDIDFSNDPLIHAVIGTNGSGKSNLIEALIQILIGFYFEKPPEFDFGLEFEAQNREITLSRKGKAITITVDRERKDPGYFAKRLRDGNAQVYYPELTLVYYSGECQRVRKLVDRYTRHFQKVTRNPESDRFRPLFLHSRNEQADVILLALFAHGHRKLLDRLNLREISNVKIEVHSPQDFDPDLHEPKLWNTKGSIARVVSALNETADRVESRRRYKYPDFTYSLRENVPIEQHFGEERQYLFDGGSKNSLGQLARRLQSGDENLYLALEKLQFRGMLKSVSYGLKGRNMNDHFAFEHLSEGEKQLLAVVGAVTLTNQKDNLVLLDEPDTHLNPNWLWEYPSLLSEAFETDQRPHSTVLMTTHDPVMISGMVKEQVLLAQSPGPDRPLFSRPIRNPRGQGVANLLCSSEYFGLPSSLDKETQKLLDERLRISIKPELTKEDKIRLKELNDLLEILPGISERDPKFVEFLRKHLSS